MKRSIFIFVFCVLFVQFFQAQLKVANNGNVGIQLGTSTPLSAFAVGDVGNVNTKVYAKGSVVGVNGVSTGTSSLSGINWTYGLIGDANLFNNMHIGVLGQSFSATPLNSYRAFGVFGMAGNSSSGYNYGVFGTTYGSQYGAGIVGTTGNNRDVNISSGLYAGYFVGNVYVSGTLTGNPVVNSDKRFKKNIAILDTKSTLKNVLEMSPVEYNMQQVYVKSKGDSAIVEKGLFDEKSQMFQKKQFGLIAQDLQKMYPDLVYEDANGYLSVNYIGIIPLLIESIKELNAEIENMKLIGNSSSPYKVQSTGLVPTNNNISSASLYQNNPNPFSQSTQIKFYLPSAVNSAYLCIYDLQGKQLKQMVISERGNSSKIISASEFSPGIYLYALMADGKEIDIKKMILTE